MKSILALLLFAQVSPSSIPQQKLVTSSGEEVKCKLVWEVQSRVPTRVCRTLAEWSRIEKENQDEWKRAGRNTAACQPNVPC